MIDIALTRAARNMERLIIYVCALAVIDQNLPNDHTKPRTALHCIRNHPPIICICRTRHTKLLALNVAGGRPSPDGEEDARLSDMAGVPPPRSPNASGLLQIRSGDAIPLYISSTECNSQLSLFNKGRIDSSLDNVSSLSDESRKSVDCSLNLPASWHGVGRFKGLCSAQNAMHANPGI